MIDVTGLATDTKPFRLLLPDWSSWVSSGRDWSDPSKSELHSHPIDSILLQFQTESGEEDGSLKPSRTSHILKTVDS